MAAISTVPVTITSEAAARIAELGMQSELEQMIEHTRQVVPHLLCMEVVLEGPYETHDEPYVTIEATCGGPVDDNEMTEGEWGDWKMETFPPQVYQHFSMMVLSETDNGR